MKSYNHIRRGISQSLSCTSLLAALLLYSCTDRFEEFNTDPTGLTDEDLKIDYQNVGGFFPQMQHSIYYNFNNTTWEYQVYQNLNADVFSGYMSPPTPFANNTNNTTYALVDGWNGFTYNLPYTGVLAPFMNVKRRADEDPGASHFYAVGVIHKVASMHRLTDTFGPIVYTQAGQGGASARYDSQQQVYEAMFDELEEAVTILTDYVAENPGLKPFARFDNIYAGDYSKWIKYANSLRLRLAMRISKVAPDKAQAEAEAAVNNQFGVFTASDDAAFVQDPGVQHPLYTIANGWGDIRMSAEMESILKGYNDPRLKIYFAPATKSGVAGEYKGIRSGIVINAKDDYVGFSSINADYIGLNSPLQLMTTAEVYFLRAEGALRGWQMGGSAQELYEKGISASFEQVGASGYDGYIADATSVAVPYTDPVNAANNVPAGSPWLSDITIQWVEAAPFEEKLERIITQKWIAMFPEGQEAWSEFRRTGYPTQFPVVENRSGGTINTNEFIKRLAFPSSESQNNAAAYQEAVQLLGGPDTGGTPLWWDVD
ncbi:RagB/SusD family nutrient uptake outer membrane protein [Cesiribacter sp. SM1]|uniref:RagB/SusD family nutrient uptake outer membrane protein n=1 Tax=Cesiribacter sp. SM1 TaxID=2861196 RepID=UPI001CD4C744|nr:RagB/SusD family nutrient uptake outer membrane protein [Cesiribacter sp. SM1]